MSFSSPSVPAAPCLNPLLPKDSFFWVCRLLQTADSAFPTGAYAHSFGLEGLVQSGAIQERSGLRTFLLEQALPQLARCDLPVAARAWRLCKEEPDWDKVKELCYLGSALKGTKETRSASEAVGKQRLEMAALLHGGLAVELKKRAAETGWPVPACVAAGLEGACLQAPLEAVLQALIYGTVSGLVAAAVKLLRLGQNAAQTLIAEVLGQCSEIIDTALSLADAELGQFNPWWDIASSRHETAHFRLFIS